MAYSLCIKDLELSHDIIFTARSAIQTALRAVLMAYGSWI